jgi:hypothetical protein
MTWQVYYYGIFIAQFIKEAHARDFQRYNRNIIVASGEDVPDEELYNKQFTTTEIGLVLYYKTGMWL